jgi:hypothetical protein
MGLTWFSEIANWHYMVDLRYRHLAALLADSLGSQHRGGFRLLPSNTITGSGVPAPLPSRMAWSAYEVGLPFCHASITTEDSTRVKVASWTFNRSKTHLAYSDVPVPWAEWSTRRHSARGRTVSPIPSSTVGNVRLAVRTLASWCWSPSLKEVTRGGTES